MKIGLAVRLEPVVTAQASGRDRFTDRLTIKASRRYAALFKKRAPARFLIERRK
jgi:hypothetical protein